VDIHHHQSHHLGTLDQNFSQKNNPISAKHPPPIIRRTQDSFGRIKAMKLMQRDTLKLQYSIILKQLYILKIIIGTQ
jgi:hypothetical protein